MDVVQLVERYIWDVEVAGSCPAIHTTKKFFEKLGVQYKGITPDFGPGKGGSLPPTPTNFDI